MKLKVLFASAAFAVAGFSWASADPMVQVGTGGAPANTSGAKMANPNADLSWVLANYIPGLTEWSQPKGSTWFGTFCLEEDEFVSGGPWYDAVVNTQAENGGTNTNSGDPLSQGTAFLYAAFVKGTLNSVPGTGFIYNDDASTQALQEAIWSLEDETPSVMPAAYAAVLTAQFGSVANAKLDYTGNVVRVLNLTSDGGQVLNQDVLVYVPDGGMTAILLGVGLLSLALVKRRVA